MATENNTVRKPYERPTLAKSADLKRVVANVGTPPVHTFATEE